MTQITAAQSMQGPGHFAVGLIICGNSDKSLGLALVEVKASSPQMAEATARAETEKDYPGHTILNAVVLRLELVDGELKLAGGQ